MKRVFTSVRMAGGIRISQKYIIVDCPTCLDSLFGGTGQCPACKGAGTVELHPMKTSNQNISQGGEIKKLNLGRSIFYLLTGSGLFWLLYRLLF